MFPQPPQPCLPSLPALSRCRAPLLCVHVATAATNNKNQNQMLNKSNKLPSKWGKMLCAKFHVLCQESQNFRLKFANA